jgi:uncharacterized protein (DUF1501 family)
MRKVKLASLALIAVFAFGAVAAMSATAVPQPEFKTLSGNTLAYTGKSGPAVLRGGALGGAVEAEILCEESNTTGNILNNSPLTHKVAVSFSGKCEQNGDGDSKTACKEPILLKETVGELGLLLVSSLHEEVGLVLKPVSGTEFVTTECGSSKTTVTGEIIGTFPEMGKYNKLETEAKLEFTANKTTKQTPTEIDLLGVEMKKVELKVEVIFGESASQEETVTLKGDGKTEIKT